jgi:hypothetical protein
MNLKNLQFLFKPEYWIMNYRYNKDFDELINRLLDTYELTETHRFGYTCKLGDTEIWIGNMPYAFVTLYNTELPNYRPSRLTIQRLLKRYEKLKEQNLKDKIQQIAELTPLYNEI